MILRAVVTPQNHFMLGAVEKLLSVGLDKDEETTNTEGRNHNGLS